MYLLHLILGKTFFLIAQRKILRYLNIFLELYILIVIGFGQALLTHPLECILITKYYHIPSNDSLIIIYLEKRKVF